MTRMPPVPVTALPRVQDWMSFLYLEHCVVHREDGALTARNDQGTIRVPAASLVAVFLDLSFPDSAFRILREAIRPASFCCTPNLPPGHPPFKCV